ncbi:hypothetical protein [Clostridium tagluense]|uniref:hypothetical protein n=1 Tax=Clostridium tagluense TaxID=360422 RepID=UPI0035564DC0
MHNFLVLHHNRHNTVVPFCLIGHLNVTPTTARCRRGDTFARHTDPVYHTKDMDKTVKWFEDSIINKVYMIMFWSCFTILYKII